VCSAPEEARTAGCLLEHEPQTDFLNRGGLEAFGRAQRYDFQIDAAAPIDSLDRRELELELQLVQREQRRPVGRIPAGVKGLELVADSRYQVSDAELGSVAISARIVLIAHEPQSIGRVVEALGGSAASKRPREGTGAPAP
jgi:hypothetical protein